MQPQIPTLESPLTPEGFRFAWDSVSLGALKECPRKYFYSIEEGWQPKRKSTHLSFGSHLHKALERFKGYVAKGIDRETSLETVILLALEESRDMESYRNKTRDSLIAAIIDYADSPAMSLLPTVILSDGTPAIELSFRFPITVDDPLGYIKEIVFCGHIDRIEEFGGTPYVVDTKTTARTLGENSAASFFEEFNPNSQFAGYSFAAHAVFGVPVRGVIIEGIQIAKTFTRFERGISHRTPNQIEEWRSSLPYWVGQASAFKATNYYPMNEQACHKYGGCVFRGICSKDPAVRSLFLETHFEKRPWNPLIPRTQSEGTISEEAEADAE